MTTTDPTTERAVRAVRTVARRVLKHIIAATEVDEKWEDYPDISEDDWRAVAADVRRLAERTDVQTEHYESAYRHLAGRGRETEEGPQWDEAARDLAAEARDIDDQHRRIWKGTTR